MMVLFVGWPAAFIDECIYPLDWAIAIAKQSKVKRGIGESVYPPDWLNWSAYKIERDEKG